MGGVVLDILEIGVPLVLAGFITYVLVLAELQRRRRCLALMIDQVFLYVMLYAFGASFLGLTCYAVEVAQQAGDFLIPASIVQWVHRIMIGCFVSAGVTAATGMAILLIKKFMPTSR